jgi:hypothetical protein
MESSVAGFSFPMRKFAEIRRRVIDECGADPYRRFLEHRGGAKARGIEFDMSFEEWWAIWESRFANRGRGVGNSVMCRAADAGPYRADNVRIDTVFGNVRERVAVGARSVMRGAWGDSTASSDWLKKRFQPADYFDQDESEEEF